MSLPRPLAATFAALVLGGLFTVARPASADTSVDTESRVTTRAAYPSGPACRSSLLPKLSRSAKTDALAKLARLTVVDDSAAVYDRAAYRHWTDVDDDGFDGRQQTLGTTSLIDATVDLRYNVIAGKWCDPYLGIVITVPGNLDVDHFVPLKEAHRSGAAEWTAEQREAFANDSANRYGTGGRQLLAVAASVNRSKADRDPAEWMPPNRAVRCSYLVNWVRVKTTYNLTMNPAEHNAVKTALTACRIG